MDAQFNVKFSCFIRAIMEQDPRFEFEYSIPTVRILSDYKIDGQVLIVPVKGEGMCQMNLSEYSSYYFVNVYT